MDTYLHRGLIYLCWITIIFNTVNCLTCGQTKCTDGEYCCSKTEGTPKNCCCRNDPTGFSIRCVSSSSTSFVFPWWGAVLIVVAIIAIIAAVVFVLYRRRKRQTYGQI